VDPTSNSTFVWRVKSTDVYSETVTEMTYDNWASGQPSYYWSNLKQSCMVLWSGRSCVWDDVQCSSAVCSVCELDI